MQHLDQTFSLWGPWYYGRLQKAGMDGQKHCSDPEHRPCPDRFGFPNCDATASDQKAGSSAVKTRTVKI